MQFETLKKNNLKKYLLGVSVFIVIVLAIIFARSFAKYKVVDSAKLASGTVNYTLPDFQIVEMYKNDGTGDEPITDMPEGKYTIDEERSFCYLKDRNTKEEGITLTTNEAGEHVIGKFQRGSKCILYFNKELGPADKTLAALGLTANKESDGCPVVDENGNASVTGIEGTKKLICSSTDDYGSSYYFRGKADNWVKFAGKLWRIIRINGDGSIRLIYAGESSSQVGPKSNGTNALTGQAYNKTYGDNTYVGFTNFGGSTANKTYEQARTGSNPSDILGVLNDWYTSNLQSVEDKLEKEAGFCNDRQKSSNTHGSSSYTNKGYGTEPTWYAPFDRVAASATSSSYASVGSEQKPTLKCGSTTEDFNKDYYTATDSTRGNHKLTYPIGLITMDEVIFAGGFAGQNNTGYWLYTGEYYWTMSPRSMNTNGNALVFRVYSDGDLAYSPVNGGSGVRPVINLKANTTFTFHDSSSATKGTVTNPYEVS